MFKNVKSLSVSLDEIVQRERRVRFVCVTVIYVIKVVKDVVQVRHVVKRGLDWTCKTRTGLKCVKRGLDSNLQNADGSQICKTRTGLKFVKRGLDSNL